MVALAYSRSQTSFVASSSQPGLLFYPHSAPHSLALPRSAISALPITFTTPYLALQAQVDNAPTFPVVLKMFEKFLIKNGLIDAVTGDRLVNFCWCSDGPFDVQNFVVKQCFISKVRLPLSMRSLPGV